MQYSSYLPIFLDIMSSGNLFFRRGENYFGGDLKNQREVIGEYICGLDGALCLMLNMHGYCADYVKDIFEVWIDE